MSDQEMMRTEYPLKRILGWEDITRQVDELVKHLDREYDAILVVTRGGMIPAGLISEKLNIRNILVAAVQLYTGVGTTLDAPIFLQFPSDTLLAGKSVLIIDDVWDSGRTAVAVKQRTELAGGKPTIVVLHYKPCASRFPDDAPDHYAEITADWIVYPWDDER